ncbi:MAG: hypothetical protein JNK56_22020 [Myxococcales bacterium]|nr:hypothetical protein [Myxococcales bacterium]
MRTTTPFFITTLLLACGPGAPPLATTDDGTTAQATTDLGTTTSPTTSGTSGAAPVSTGELSTGASSSSTGSEFIMPPDGGSGCFAGAVGPEHQPRCTSCDIFRQDCGDGEKCVPWAADGAGWNATRCSPVLGTGVAGDPCTVEGTATSGFDDCAFGHLCWDVDDQLHGTCVAMCTGTQRAPECPASTGCLIANEGVLALCLRTCDPLVQDCPPTDICIQSTDSPFVCGPDGSGREGQANDPCESLDGCDPGLHCAVPGATSGACDPDASGCCTPFCTLPDGPCPNPDQACVPWYPVGEAPPGEEDIGACALPP